ncbi:MAG: AmmeMemoRadiSam system radical SAM enzyme [Candidatus Omnitrophica bacterium]|nr:AmmeMemoRadiSam system radical SAM enzyme [Candidatus Omnitrophota bacterium]
MKEAMFYDRCSDNAVNCFLCAHKCRILPGETGFCRVRENRNGTLHSLVYGKPVAMNLDPIEKKPLYHFLPGSFTYSIATLGCNFKCEFCQNWQISQVPEEKNDFRIPYISPEDIVKTALDSGAKSISYTYNEPTVFFEYAYDICRLAKKKHLANIFVTNGYLSKEAVETVSPYLDAANIDLKSFSDGFYRKFCKGSLKPVLDTIKLMNSLGIWIEITTLVIPGENDSQKELKETAEFIAGLNKKIPWHISRFHPDFKLSKYRDTPLTSLEQARGIGIKAGLKNVYLGNVSGVCDTNCPQCGKLLIKRDCLRVSENNVKNGKCSFCQAPFEGVCQI